VDGTILDVDKQAYTAGGALTAVIDPGTALYTTLAARQLVRAADHALDTQRQDSTFAAAEGYYDLAKARALAGVVQEALRVSAEYQRQLHEAVGSGIAFKGDELRVQVQTERYQVLLRQALEQQRVTAARLSQVLHLDSSLELVPEDADLVPLTLLERNAPLDSLVQAALQARPELKQSQALEAAARQTKNSTVYGPLIPSLGAQLFAGGLGGGKNDQVGNFGPSEDYFVGLGWRIGPGGLFDMGRIHASKARLAAVRLDQEKVRDEVIRQVVERQTRLLSLGDQLAVAKQNLTTASETLRLTRERKQFGVGVVLEDIQAQQELTRARSDYLNVIAEFNKAQYGLAKAVGATTGTTDTGTPAPLPAPPK
jgi:outer membrane protein TolC